MSSFEFRRMDEAIANEMESVDSSGRVQSPFTSNHDRQQDLFMDSRRCFAPITEEGNQGPCQIVPSHETFTGERNPWWNFERGPFGMGLQGPSANAPLPGGNLELEGPNFNFGITDDDQSGYTIGISGNIVSMEVGGTEGDSGRGNESGIRLRAGLGFGMGLQTINQDQDNDGVPSRGICIDGRLGGICFETEAFSRRQTVDWQGNPYQPSRIIKEDIKEDA